MHRASDLSPYRRHGTAHAGCTIVPALDSVIGLSLRCVLRLGVLNTIHETATARRRGAGSQHQARARRRHATHTTRHFRLIYRLFISNFSSVSKSS
jgi:hypothetical protein